MFILIWAIEEPRAVSIERPHNATNGIGFVLLCLKLEFHGL